MKIHINDNALDRGATANTTYNFTVENSDTDSQSQRAFSIAIELE